MYVYQDFEKENQPPLKMYNYVRDDKNNPPNTNIVMII